MTEYLETMHCPDWVDAEPFRAHVRDLICETGLSWRLVAAHAGVAPRAVRSLLHGRRGYTLHRLHVSIARALTTTSIESIAADQHLVTDATATRQLSSSWSIMVELIETAAVMATPIKDAATSTSISV